MPSKVSDPLVNIAHSQKRFEHGVVAIICAARCGPGFDHEAETRADTVADELLTSVPGTFRTGRNVRNTKADVRQGSEFIGSRPDGRFQFRAVSSKTTAWKTKPGQQRRSEVWRAG